VAVSGDRPRKAAKVLTCRTYSLCNLLLEPARRHVDHTLAQRADGFVDHSERAPERLALRLSAVGRISPHELGANFLAVYDEHLEVVRERPHFLPEIGESVQESALEDEERLWPAFGLLDWRRLDRGQAPFDDARDAELRFCLTQFEGDDAAGRAVAEFGDGEAVIGDIAFIVALAEARKDRVGCGGLGG
jgi:hypothetical protein